MTLHWWMHWFWVTAQIVVSLTSPTTDRPQSDHMAISDSSVTTSIPMLESSSSVSAMPSPSPSPDSAMRLRYTETTESLPGRLQQNYRIAKAIGIQPTELVSAEPQSLRLVTTPLPDNLRSTPVTGDNKTAFEVFENKTTQPGRIPGKKESKITWVHAFSKPPRTKYEDKASSSTTTPIPIGDELLTVMPLRELQPQQIDPNAIRREHVHLPKVMAAAAASSSGSNSNNSRSSGLLLGEETPVESHAIATAASVLDANVGDSTRLGRARGTFSSEFQREQLSREEQQHRAEHKEETMKKEGTESSENVTEIATITGSCLAVIVLLSTVGSLGFIMYRRRYLNPPQTLNSDKCSNPDSSGYIDDSTIRDNSEEMYSLDNDSFLNSLEAMTIQNYWTDSVKHTKL